jgi:hypothetical protein
MLVARRGRYDMSAIGRRDALALLGGALASGGLGGCSRELGRYRFLYTVRIEVDGQVRSGSSVVEFRASSLIEAHNYALREVGVAPRIDLGKDRGILFATLMGRNSTFEATSSHLEYSELYVVDMLSELFVPLKERQKWATVSRRLDHARESTLPPEYRPDFVWVPPGATQYGDLQMVHSHEFEDVIGTGIRYVDCSLSPTRLAVQTQLDIDAPWLVSLRDNRLKASNPSLSCLELGE